jgi:hypothetical protein
MGCPFSSLTRVDHASFGHWGKVSLLSVTRAEGVRSYRKATLPPLTLAHARMEPRSPPTLSPS